MLKNIGTDFLVQQISLYIALTIFLFRLKVLRFSHRLEPFHYAYLHVTLRNRFIRDRKAWVHKPNFFFLSLVTYHLHVFLKIREKYLEKNYPLCKINSQCRKTELLKKEVCNGISCISAF